MVGVYRSTGEAREAMVMLEQAGINGGRLEVVGRQAATGAVPPPDAAGAVVGYVSSVVWRGAAVGAGLGLVFGLFQSLQAGDGWWEPELWAPILVAIFPGAAIGGLIAFRFNVAMSPAWTQTFAEIPAGTTCVALEVKSDQEQAEAAERLRETVPERVLVARPVRARCAGSAER